MDRRASLRCKFEELRDRVGYSDDDIVFLTNTDFLEFGTRKYPARNVEDLNFKDLVTWINHMQKMLEASR